MLSSRIPAADLRGWARRSIATLLCSLLMLLVAFSGGIAFVGGVAYGYDAGSGGLVGAPAFHVYDAVHVASNAPTTPVANVGTGVAVANLGSTGAWPPVAGFRHFLPAAEEGGGGADVAFGATSQVGRSATAARRCSGHERCRSPATATGALRSPHPGPRRHESRGEPDALRGARPVRRAGRGNGPAERLTPRPGPTPTPICGAGRADCSSAS